MRHGTGEFLQFLGMATGSLAETETHLNSGATSGDDHGGRDDAAGSASVGSWANAQRAQTLAALQGLTGADFPLALTTDHWTQVTVRGVDVFDPSTGEVRSDDTDGIACWFIDTDYDSESFFVRHAYFLGANDPYKALKTTLKAEIDADAWATLRSDTSRPFPRPESGRIAVKVINHLGDEVLKVFASIERGIWAVREPPLQGCPGRLQPRWRKMSASRRRQMTSRYSAMSRRPSLVRPWSRSRKKTGSSTTRAPPRLSRCSSTTLKA